MTRPRQVHEAGHRRKILLVADGSKEFEPALFYAASRAEKTGGGLVLLYIIEPENNFWGGVRAVQIEEETNKARAVFRLLRLKLTKEGIVDLAIDEVIREGKKVEQILKLIEEDTDIAILALGAATDSKGPGPLISALVSGTAAGQFPVPITIVPGGLAIADIRTMA
jgi:nucleotide-binding universal stress UspA family protein